MKYARHLPSRSYQVAAELERAMNAPGDQLAPAALAIARVEYPSFDASGYLREIQRLGEEAAQRVGHARAQGREAIHVLNEFLYDDQRFTGNREHYDDPRNSFLNEVLDRRTGIPISLAVVYLEVARRAGVSMTGLNFPGHFLLRADDAQAPPILGDRFLIVDPFHGGALLSEVDCRELLRSHVGEQAAFHPSLLEPATRRHIVVRMLLNLKRLYVRMRSFPQARFVADLLLAIDPADLLELRDRGLMAYHLQDFGAALRDLEAYLRHVPRYADAQAVRDTVAEPEEEDDEERPSGTDDSGQIWEHVKNLRKHVATFN